MHAVTWTLLALGTIAYAVGVRRLWQRAGFGRAIGLSQVLSFSGGMLVLLLALLSPLHHLAEERLWAHMVQHELLMVIAAPLLVAARPLVALRLALPKWLSDPLVAWIAHAAAIWVWHVPGIFEAAAHHEGLHFAQHASFLVTALMFWWTVFARPGAGVASLFTTMLYTGALGALMALSNRSWYAGYALEDQQLAGLVMWVPAGAAYPLAALLLLGRTLRRCAT
jgi:putative membrane protein